MHKLIKNGITYTLLPAAGLSTFAAAQETFCRTNALGQPIYRREEDEHAPEEDRTPERLEIPRLSASTASHTTVGLSDSYFRTL
jgi:hypothetical protein